MIDFHTHILPGIDDGSKSAEESVLLLKKLKEQGVSKVILTPHFYAYSSTAERFENGREEALDDLLEALSKTPVDIDIYLGCEVLYFEDLWQIENLKNFCIQGTDCILLEMPFSEWTDTMVRSVEKVIGKGFTPIIAHFERYLSYNGNMEKLYQFVEMGALLQMNCDFLNNFFTKRRAVRFVKRGIASMLGTDCHNLTDRSPQYLTAFSYLRKKLSEEQYKRFSSIQRRVLANAQKIYPAK